MFQDWVLPDLQTPVLLPLKIKCSLPCSVLQQEVVGRSELLELIGDFIINKSASVTVHKTSFHSCDAFFSRLPETAAEIGNS